MLFRPTIKVDFIKIFKDIDETYGCLFLYVSPPPPPTHTTTTLSLFLLGPLGTGSPGRPPGLSRSSRALNTES